MSRALAGKQHRVRGLVGCCLAMLVAVAFLAWIIATEPGQARAARYIWLVLAAMVPPEAYGLWHMFEAIKAGEMPYQKRRR